MSRNNNVGKHRTVVVCREAVAHADPISISANYLKPPSSGDAEIWVEVLRTGRRQSTVSVKLIAMGRRPSDRHTPARRMAAPSW